VFSRGTSEFRDRDKMRESPRHGSNSAVSGAARDANWAQHARISGKPRGESLELKTGWRREGDLNPETLQDLLSGIRPEFGALFVPEKKYPCRREFCSPGIRQGFGPLRFPSFARRTPGICDVEHQTKVWSSSLSLLGGQSATQLCLAICTRRCSRRRRRRL
jgi:hypothetical protein